MPQHLGSTGLHILSDQTMMIHTFINMNCVVRVEAIEQHARYWTDADAGTHIQFIHMVGKAKDDNLADIYMHRSLNKLKNAIFSLVFIISIQN